MTGLDLMRKFPENMARPMLKKARKDLTNTYGEYFIDYTYDINSQQPVRINLSIMYLLRNCLIDNLFRLLEKLLLPVLEKDLVSLRSRWRSVF